MATIDTRSSMNSSSTDRVDRKLGTGWGIGLIVAILVAIGIFFAIRGQSPGAPSGMVNPAATQSPAATANPSTPTPTTTNAEPAATTSSPNAGEAAPEDSTKPSNP